MSATTLFAASGAGGHIRPVALAVEIVACLVILIWTLTPLYSMVAVALRGEGRRLQRRPVAGQPDARRGSGPC